MTRLSRGLTIPHREPRPAHAWHGASAQTALLHGLGPLCPPPESQDLAGKALAPRSPIMSVVLRSKSLLSLSLPTAGAVRPKSEESKCFQGKAWGFVLKGSSAGRSTVLPLGRDHFTYSDHAVSTSDLKYYTWNNDKLPTSQHHLLINGSFLRDGSVCLICFRGVTNGYFKNTQLRRSLREIISPPRAARPRKLDFIACRPSVNGAPGGAGPAPTRWLRVSMRISCRVRPAASPGGRQPRSDISRFLPLLPDGR